MSGIYLDDAELDALRGLPHLARVIYTESLRRRMDFNTGLVGARVGAAVSWRAIYEDVYVDTHCGPVQRAAAIPAVRRGTDWLVRVDLVQMRGDRNALKLVLFLPKARLYSHVQNQPGSNPADYSGSVFSQRKSTATRQSRRASTRQTSEFRESSIHQAAAATFKGGETLVFPQAFPQTQRDAVLMIARTAALTPKEAQLLLDELIAKMAVTKVLNPPRFFNALVQQLRTGTFDGTGAAAVRSGGKPLSEEEAKLAEAESGR